MPESKEAVPVVVQELTDEQRVAKRLKLKPGQHARLIKSNAALELADLTGVQHDMRLVADACRIITHRSGSPSTDAVRRACLDSAVMRYRRGFNGGKRKGLPDGIVDQLTPAERKLHETVLNLADWSIAHCVDGSEENVTYLRIGPAEEGGFPLQVCVFTTVVRHFETIGSEKLEALARRVELLARALADRIAPGILEDARAAGGKAVSEWPRVTSAITDAGDVTKERYEGAVDPSDGRTAKKEAKRARKEAAAAKRNAE